MCSILTILEFLSLITLVKKLLYVSQCHIFPAVTSFLPYEYFILN